LCEFRVGLRAEVGKVKQRVCAACGVPASQQRLVFGSAELLDDATLAEAGVTSAAVDDSGLPVIAVQCVRTLPSDLARSLDTLAGMGCPELAVGADVFDRILRMEHELSERCRPRDAAAASRGLEPTHRVQMVCWIVQAFSVLQLGEALLHSFVLTLDRYSATHMGPLWVGDVQKVLLAVVCSQLKVVGAQEFPDGHWQRVIMHLSRGSVDLGTILEWECKVLRALDYQVDVPTPVTFLRELSLRSCSDEVSAMAAELACFLLGLCMFEPETQYRHPHSVLAGGALLAALLVLEAQPQHRAQCAEARQRLALDLEVYRCPADRGASGDDLGPCAAALLELWAAHAANGHGDEGAQVYSEVARKFARQLRAAGVELGAETPRAALLRLGLL